MVGVKEKGGGFSRPSERSGVTSSLAAGSTVDIRLKLATTSHNGLAATTRFTLASASSKHCSDCCGVTRGKGRKLPATLSGVIWVIPDLECSFRACSSCDLSQKIFDFPIQILGGLSAS